LRTTQRLAVLAIVPGLLSASLIAAAATPAGPFDGAWTLAPAYSTTCSAGPISANVTVGRVFTRQIGADSLEIKSDVVVSGPGLPHFDTHTLKVRLDSAARTLSFSGPVGGGVARQGYSATVSGMLHVRGTFVDPDRIRAEVQTTLSVSVTTPGGAASGVCTPFDATIVATRARE
jgi:hypothetical protein